MATIAQLPTYITTGLDNEDGITSLLSVTMASVTQQGIYMQRWYNPPLMGNEWRNPTHTYMDGAVGNDGKNGIDGAGSSVKSATRVTTSA